MKVQYRGKCASIERVSNEAVRIKMHMKGKVLEPDLAPSAKDSEMTLEFGLRPAVADGMLVGQMLVVTVESTDTKEED